MVHTVIIEAICVNYVSLLLAIFFFFFPCTTHCATDHPKPFDLNGNFHELVATGKANLRAPEDISPGEVKWRGFLRGSHYQTCSEIQSPLTLPAIMHSVFQCNM